MSLISKIKTAVEAQGLEFHYDSGGNLEELIGNADFENDKCVVFAFLLENETFEDGKESGQIGLFFSKLSEVDFDSMENDAIQDECKAIAYDFLKSLDSGNTLTYGTVNLQRFYDTFHVNVTGVAIQAVFSEMSGLSTCLSQ